MSTKPPASYSPTTPPKLFSMAPAVQPEAPPGRCSVALWAAAPASRDAASSGSATRPGGTSWKNHTKTMDTYGKNRVDNRIYMDSYGFIWI